MRFDAGQGRLHFNLQPKTAVSVAGAQGELIAVSTLDHPTVILLTVEQYKNSQDKRFSERSCKSSYRLCVVTYCELDSDTHFGCTWVQAKLCKLLHI